MSDEAERRERFVAALVFVVALAVRLPRAWLSPRAMVIGFVPDDSFYYLTIARNVAEGRGVTFDGTVSTNGFHPLWAACLSALATVFRDRALLSAAVALGAICGAAMVVSVSSILRRLEVSSLARAIAIAWLTFHALAIDLSTSAIEAPVHGLCFSLLVLAAIDPRAAERPLRLGALAGLLVLSRTDSVLLALPAVWPIARKRDARALGKLVLAGALVISPWILLSIVSLGGLVQSSGIAFPLLLRRQAEARGIVGFGRTLGHSLSQLLEWSRWCAAWCAAKSIPFLFVLAALLARLRRRTPDARFLVALFFVAAASTLLLHGALRWLVREWYVSPLLVMLTVGLALLCDDAVAGVARFTPKLTKHRFSWVAAPIVLGTAMIDGGYFDEHLPRYPWQAEMFDAARWVQTNVPRDQTIGAFNAGIEGFVSGHRVVDLDGVVDMRAVDALRSRTLGDYLRARQVRVVVDYRYSYERDYAPFFGDSRVTLVTRTTLPGSWNGSEIVVWRVVDEVATP